MNEYKKPAIEQLSQNLHLLTFEDGKKLYLIGTAHVSAESVKLVEDTIQEVNPDIICIELDEQRYKSIKGSQNFENLDIIQIIRKKQLYFFIGQLLLSGFQKKIAKQTGSKPGAEFIRASVLAEERNTELVLADRNIGTTLKRAWRLTGFFKKFKILFSLLFSNKKETEDIDIEKLKAADVMDNMVQEFADELPETKKILINERDTYMAYKIQNNLKNTTVAVVGAGHVKGMLNCFKKKIPAETMETINYIPPVSKLSKIVPWIVPLVVIGLFTLGFFYGNNKSMAQEILIFWILINGILSAAGCLIGLAHPLTIVAGFIAAPLTSINPTIGAGFVTGIVQGLLVKPRLIDFMKLQDGALKMKDWWSNRITRILLVFIFSSLGSSIGTFIALPVFIKLFG